MNDLDLDFVAEYCRKIGYEKGDAEFYLRHNQDFVTVRGDEEVVSGAAILLFGKYPQRFFPRARVRFVRYEGKTAELGDRMNVVKDVKFTGRILDQIKDTVAFVKTQIREYTKLGEGAVFRTVPEYPEFCWTELIVNAVAHRDYSIGGTDIQVKMFDDHFTVESPGILPGLVRVNNIREFHFSRNPMIVELLNEYEFPGDDIPIISGSALKAGECGCGSRDCEWCGPIWELMDEVDSYIPTPERDTDKPFLMPIEDVFTITGRGTVVTGRVERGQVKVGDEVQIVGLQDDIRKTVVTGVEMFRKMMDYAEAGDNIGCLLRGVDRKEVERGQVLAKPETIKPHTKFTGEVYVLTKEEGGRHTPFFNGYRPQFYFRTTDVTGVAMLPEGVEMVMPGDNIKMTIELITPIAIEQGLRFAIREGGRTVGSGVVSSIIE